MNGYSVRIPPHDYSVSELEETKVYACTYIFERRESGNKYVSTEHIQAKNMGQALIEIESMCADHVDFKCDWSSYKLKSIVEI